MNARIRSSITSIVKAGSTAQVTTTEPAGTYCVNVSDVGNLFGPAGISLTVAHP